LIIHAEPSAEGFYKQMGAIRIGEVPFFYSPEIILPHLLYLVPRTNDACDRSAKVREDVLRTCNRSGSNLCAE
jgi:hypothetical protein